MSSKYAKTTIFKYIFSQYYLAKYGEIDVIKREVDYQNIQVEHLIARKSDFSIGQKDNEE